MMVNRPAAAAFIDAPTRTVARSRPTPGVLMAAPISTKLAAIAAKLADRERAGAEAYGEEAEEQRPHHTAQIEEQSAVERLLHGSSTLLEQPGGPACGEIESGHHDEERGPYRAGGEGDSAPEQ